MAHATFNPCRHPSVPFSSRYGRHFAAQSLGAAIVPLVVCLLNDLIASVNDDPPHASSSSTHALTSSNETSISSNESSRQSLEEAIFLPFEVRPYEYSSTHPEAASVMLHYCFYGVLLSMSAVIVLTSQYETHRGSDLLRRSLRGFPGVGGRFGCLARSKFLCSDVR